MKSKDPRNKEGESPTHGSRDTAKRLEAKAKGQRGRANRSRTMNKAGGASTKR